MNRWQSICTLLLMLAGSQCVAATTSYGRLGEVTLHEPRGRPRELVLLISGDDGWSTDDSALARTLAERGSLVAGIDIRQFGKSLRSTSEGCIFASGDLEGFAHDIERRYRFPTYVNPILLGTGTGATLAYGILVQSPVGTFKGALSLGFCATLPWNPPLCRGDGAGLESSTAPDQGFMLHPATGLRDPWIVIPEPSAAACPVTEAQKFASQIPGAKLIEPATKSPGSSATRGNLGPILAAVDELAGHDAPGPAATPVDIADLPLIEVPAKGPDGDVFAIMLTGDGGWAGLDREVAAVLTNHGVAVVGWDSLRYFWKARTPEGAAKDLDRIIRHYLRQWGKSRVVAVGYSLGAETMPFIVNRLSPDTREKVALTALLAPGPEAFFEFHVSLWLGREHGGLPLGPELRRLAGSNLLCVYGADESDSSCAGLTDPAFHIVRLPGGHHFDGDYEALGRYILEQFVRK